MTTERSRRSRRSSTTSRNPRSYSSSSVRTREARTAAATGDSSDESRPVRSAAVDWSQEYNYILKDLRQLFIVSALLFAGLLVVGFLIQ
jgi:hypothetical protein